MKRRISWTQWTQWLKVRRRAQPRPASSIAAPNPMPYRVLLRFRDGSSEVLDPRSPVALEFHALADEWLIGRR